MGQFKFLCRNCGNGIKGSSMNNNDCVLLTHCGNCIGLNNPLGEKETTIIENNPEQG